jgi:phosphate transport system permease protein
MMEPTADANADASALHEEASPVRPGLAGVGVPVANLPQPGEAEAAGLRQLRELGGHVAPARRPPHPPARTSNLGDRVFHTITSAFAGLTIAVLFVMVAVVAWQSRFSITGVGFSFLTSTTWDVTRDIYGAEPEILGTVYTALFALLLAAPIAIMVAIYLVEFAPRRVRFGLGFVVELLAAVPSVVYGLWALLVLVPDVIAPHVQPFLVQHFGNAPVLSGFLTGYPTGLGILTASIILAIMILPTIASIGRDVMLAVPNSQRDAMLALGATRWETTWKAVVPYARSGIIGAIILGLGRAVGETMAVQMVIGNQHQISPSWFQGSTTMAASIVTQLREATGQLYISALLELALILMIITVLLNALARALVWVVAR